MHVHCILKNQPQVVKVIENFKGITNVTHDNSFDEAVHWSETVETPPDLIFCDEYAYGSKLDPQTRTLNKDKALLEALKVIRFNLPDTRIVILLHSERQRDLAFLQNLIALAIYDFHFIEKEFTQEDLIRFITSKPRTLKDVASYVVMPNIKTEENDNEAKINFHTTTAKETKPILEKLKIKASKVIEKVKTVEIAKRTADTSLTEALDEATKGVEWYCTTHFPNFECPENLQTPEEQLETTIEEHKTVPVSYQNQLLIYSLGVTEDYSFVVFSSLNELKLQLETKKPDAIVLNANTPNVASIIKELRRIKKIIDVPITVIGTEPTKDLLEAGADECFLEWNKNTYSCMELKRNRLKEIWEKANNEAAKDTLTGLYNRKLLEHLSKEQINLHTERGTPFSVLICDLDHFKKINDTYGHNIGDEVIKRFASFLKENVREIDLVFRYGGEEFLIIFPRAREKETYNIANRLCVNWANLGFYESTFSGGVAEFKDGYTIEELIEIADKRLYQAKQNGRNQVIYSESNTRISKQKPKEEKQETLKPNIKEDHPRQSNVKTIAVSSLISGGGASLLASILAYFLSSQKQKVSIIDCDLENGTLGSILKLDEATIDAQSWIKNAPPVIAEYLRFYPVSWRDKDLANDEIFQNVMESAKEDVNWLILDVGSLTEEWWYKQAIDAADVIIWAYVDERIALDYARHRWQERKRILSKLKNRQRELICLFGSTLPEDLEDVFLTPCLKLKKQNDKKQLKNLAAILKKMPFKGNKKVLIAGCKNKKIPNKPDVLYDIFETPEQAVRWVENFPYDMAIIDPKSKGAALLEYDLREKGVLIRKC